MSPRICCHFNIRKTFFLQFFFIIKTEITILIISVFKRIDPLENFFIIEPRSLKFGRRI